MQIDRERLGAMKPDAVLIVGAGYLQLHAIRTARTLGLVPLVTDRDPQAPGVALAAKHYQVSTQDYKAHAALVPQIQKEYTLRGVMTAGADVAPSVAAAAQESGTPGIPLDVALRTHDKGRVRKALSFRDANLSQCQPEWALLEYPDHQYAITDMVRYISHNGARAFVVKPLSQSASRGVGIVQAGEAYWPAVENAMRYSPSILFEECLIGTEHSAEILIYNGTPIWFNIVDRIFADGGMLELGHINPSRLAPRQWEGIYTMVRAAAAALGVTWGPFKCDVMMTADGPKILECTARLSGGYDSQGTTLALGCDPTKALMQMACSMPIDARLARPGGIYAACAAAFPDPGLVLYDPRDTLCRDVWARTSYFEQAESMPGVVATHLHAHTGATIRPYQDCAARPAFVIATADTYDEAWTRAQAAAGIIAEGYITEEESRD